MVDLPNGYYMVHFNLEDDYKVALFEGPWLTTNHYMIVQRWRPLFRSPLNKVRKDAIWRHVLNLLIELYNRSFLGRIGNR